MHLTTTAIKERRTKQRERRCQQLPSLLPGRGPASSASEARQHTRALTSPQRLGCCHCCRGVALTFDDGPSEFTPRLLDELQVLDVKAAFFVLSHKAAEHADTVRRALREGHTVGLHTRSHANLTALHERGDWGAIRLEVEAAAAELEAATGARPLYFRPPFGAINREVVDYVHSLGFAVAMWTAGCIDWAFHDPERELAAIVDGLPDSGGVVCLHDTYNSTVAGTPAVVQALRSGREAQWVNPQGRRLVTLDECTGRRGEPGAEPAGAAAAGGSAGRFGGHGVDDVGTSRRRRRLVGGTREGGGVAMALGGADGDGMASEREAAMGVGGASSARRRTRGLLRRHALGSGGTS